MGYRVMFHVGDEIGLKTKGKVGRLQLEADRLVITGPDGLSIPLADLQSVELFRLHGTGRVLKLVHQHGTLFVTVIRFSLFGWFAVINFFGTGRLREELQASIAKYAPA